MIRGFVAGVLWGGLVAGIGLMVVSQVAPPPLKIAAVPEVAVVEPLGEPVAEPVSDVTAEPGPEPIIEPVVEPVVEPAATAADIPATPEPAVLPDNSAPAAPPLLDLPAVMQVPLAEPAPAAPGTETALTPVATAPRPVIPNAETAPAVPSEPNPVPGAGRDAIPEPSPPVATDAAPPAPQTDGTASAGATPPRPTAPAAETTSAPDGTVAAPAVPSEPNPVPGAGRDATPEPSPPVATDVAPPAPQADGTASAGTTPPRPTAPAAETTPAPDGTVEAPQEPSAPAENQTAVPRLLTDDQPDRLPAAGTIGNRAEGVMTGRLPMISGAETAEFAAEVPAADNLPPLQRYARAFDRAAGKPLFVILLRDIGAAGLARENLTSLPFAVTFVVDTAAPDAAGAVAAYRAAGQEVLMLATGIPAGAQPSDLEQTFQSLAATLPETLGVIDLPEGGFQDNRDLAAQVVAILKEQGRGLVTYDQGLNAADQVARREGVAATTIFRRLDGEGESITVMRRYLDRAAFRAAQLGQVVVIGDTRAETVAAVLEWTLEGRAASVTLAPVTAVLVVE